MSAQEATEADGGGAADAGAPKKLRRWWLPAILLVLIVSAGAGGVYQYFTTYRTDLATDAHVAETVKTSAKVGTVALLSYAPETLQRDFVAAKTHLSGAFLEYYNGFTEQVVKPAAMDKKIKTVAEVTNAAITEIHPASAKVLVFINQSTTSAAKPKPELTSSSVLVTLDKQGDTWLISGFDPT
jgi:Mce-associated membrane protein